MFASYAPFSPTTWIRSNPSKGVNDYPNGHELPRRSRHKSQRQGTDKLGSRGDGTYRGDSTDRIVDADRKLSKIDDGNSSTHDVSSSNTPSSNSFHNSRGSNPFVVHTMTTYGVQPEGNRSSRRDEDKKTGADVWVSAV
jgi:hypothetical protein